MLPPVFCRATFPISPMRLCCRRCLYHLFSSADIQSFIGTKNVKIAFTLGGNRDIYYVDFTDSVPAAIKLKNSALNGIMKGDSPIISPNGSFVTYYITDGSHPKGAYLQKLDKDAAPVLIDANGTEPHWWHDSSGQNYIVYSNAIVTSALTTGAGQTYRVKVSLTDNGSISGTKEQLAPYPMNGGLSKNGRYLCTAYQVAAFYDILASRLILINENMQTCNSSICPDSTHNDRMMFLNIQGKQNLINPFLTTDAFFPTDSLLEEHSVVFIVNTNNTVVDYIPLTLAATAGTYSELQDPEWSNKGNFAAVLGVVSGNTADGLLVKNIGNNSMTKAVLKFSEGSGKLNATSTPYLWIGE